MAIQLFKENEAFNVKSQHFLIDSTDELTNIESIYNCKQGDKAELPDGTIYVRHSDGYSGDLWEIRSSSSGSDSSDGGLPTPTAADVGKSMSVQPVGGTVIAPLQSGVSDDEGVVALSNFDTELFIVGATVLVEMNGEKMVGTVVSQISTGAMGVEFSNPLYSMCAVWVYNGNGYASALYINSGSNPSMTIKVSLFDSYDWVETPPNMMIVHVDIDGILDKTWQEIFDAITSGKIVSLLVGGQMDGYSFINYYNIYFAGQADENLYKVIASNAFEYYCAAPDEYPFAD